MKLSPEQCKTIRESAKDQASYLKILKTVGAEEGVSANSGKLVLVVDDEETVSSFVRLVLEQQGFETLTTTSGTACLSLLKAKTPDLILLDISMPDMDGAELFSRVRQLANTKSTPVVFITGLISTEEEAEFNRLNEEGKRYLGKPFTPQKLLKVVNSMLD